MKVFICRLNLKGFGADPRIHQILVGLKVNVVVPVAGVFAVIPKNLPITSVPGFFGKVLFG